MELDLVVELYIEGHSIDTIAEELITTNDEVLRRLRLYKQKDTNGKDYIQSFKEIVVERVMTGAKKVSISRDLGIAYKTISKYIEEFNVDVPKSKKDQEEFMFEEIEWELFNICPTCDSKKVNDLNIYKDEGIDLKNSYCLDCGTEWLEKGKKVFRVVWEFVE